jgi:hypothetical protein
VITLPEGWRRFFFEPEPVAPVILVRVAFGVIVVLWALSVLPDARAFFSDDGLRSAGAGGGLRWSVFAIADGPAVAIGAIVLLAVAGVALIAGRAPRVAALAVFVLITSLQRRNGAVFNAGDSLMRLIALYLALSPSGDPPQAQRAPWALRLMQLQLSAVYIGSVLEKLRGATWRDGTAMGIALRIDDLERFGAFRWIADHPAFVSVGTFGTLAVELAVGVGVWFPRARLPVIAAGIALHAGIALSMRVGFFSAAMLVLYLAFVPPAVAERALTKKIPWRLRPLVRLPTAKPTE